MGEFIPLAEARDLFPGRPCLATIRGWCYRGAGGKKLPFVKSGGRVFIRPCDAARFLSPSDDDLLSGANVSGGSPDRSPSPNTAEACHA